MIVLALALQAAPTPAATVLDCALVTPRGDALSFALEVGTAPGAGAVVLVPTQGSGWPKSPLAGGGTSVGRSGKFKGSYHFGSSKNGVTLDIEGEGTLLYASGSKTPRAYGFCRTGSEALEPARSPRIAATDPGVGIAALDSVNWPEKGCALITRSGRRARIDYTILAQGSESEITSADLDLFGKARIGVRRTQGSGHRPSRFSGKDGMAGAERLIVDHKTSEAVQLIDFASVGVAPARRESAVAICGHRGIVRKPAMQ